MTRLPDPCRTSPGLTSRDVSRGHSRTPVFGRNAEPSRMTNSRRVVRAIVQPMAGTAWVRRSVGARAALKRPPAGLMSKSIAFGDGSIPASVSHFDETINKYWIRGLRPAASRTPDVSIGCCADTRRTRSPGFRRGRGPRGSAHMPSRRRRIRP